MALAAYFDESSEDRSGILAVAGYFGAVEMWDESFSPAWWKVIKGAPHPIREFKAHDCRRMIGEFDKTLGWTREECDALTRDLVSVIVEPSLPLGGLGVAVVIDYDWLLSKPIRQLFVKTSDKHIKALWLNLAYEVCAAFVAYNTIKLLDDLLGKYPLQVVFDDRSKGKGAILNTFEGLKHKDHRLVRPEYKERIRTPHFGPSHELAPLQAADLLAHETYKELKNQTASPPREPSKALRRLVEGKAHDAFYLTTQDVIQLEWGIGDSLREFSRSVYNPERFDPERFQPIIIDLIDPERFDV